MGKSKRKFLAGLGSLPSWNKQNKTTGEKAALSATHVLSAVVGAGGGVFLGRGSFLAGILTIAAGAAMGETHLIAAGSGMFAGVASVSKPDEGTNGLGEFDFQKEVDAGTGRVKDLFQIGMKKAVWADEWLDDKPATSTAALPAKGTAGLGNWYFPDTEPAPAFRPAGMLNAQLI